MTHAQPGIREAVPVVARYLSFAVSPDPLAGAALPEALKRVRRTARESCEPPVNACALDLRPLGM
jgi:hypothetical protein